MSYQLKSYFYYSKNEKRGLLFLLAILVFLLVYWLYIAKGAEQVATPIDNTIEQILCEIENNKSVDADNKKYRAKLRKEEYDNKYKKWSPKEYKSNSKPNTARAPLKINSQFDPNQVTESMLSDMGLPPKTISTWLKFTKKGGTFNTPTDLSKLYNLSSSDYEQLYPFIDIPERKKTEFTSYNDTKKQSTKKEFATTPEGIISLIDLNTATADQLLPIYSIGPSTSRRIIEHRDQLGGFTDISQVAQIWWMPDSTFQQISQNVIITGSPRKTISINTSDLKTLKSHPLIDYKLAKSIYNYRKQHGRYREWKDVKKLHLIKGHEHIEPYIKY